MKEKSVRSENKGDESFPCKDYKRRIFLKAFWLNIKSQFMEEMDHIIVAIAMPALLQSCYEII